MITPATPAKPRLIDDAGLRAMGIKLHRVTRWRAIREGRFPRPLFIGGRHLWLVDEVEAWLDAQIAARDRQAPAGLESRDAARA